MGVGGFFSGFTDALTRAQEQSRRNAVSGLEEAVTLEGIRQRAQESQDLGALTAAFQDRRRALAATGGGQPMAGSAAVTPPPVAPPLSSDQAFGLENAGVPLPPAPSIAPRPSTPSLAPGAPPGAPAGEGLRRESLLETLQPELAGRLLRSQPGRMAIKDLADAEREQENERKREQANSIFTQASDALRNEDTLGYYDKVSQAFRVLGDHASAGKALEYAMNLRGDRKEESVAAADAAAVNAAKKAYEADPTSETRQGVYDALAGVKSKAWKGLQGQVMAGALKGIFDQNPAVMGFNRRVATGYQSAFAAGQEPDATTIYREAAKADPAGFNAWVFDAMANQKALPEVVRKNVMRWEDVDVKDIPKDRYAWAWRRTQAKLPGIPQNDPRFLETLNQELAAAAKIEQRAKADEKATSPYEEARNLRSDVDAARKRLHDVRAELRNLRDPVKGTQDPAREQDLIEEEAAAKRSLDFYEGKMGKKAGMPDATADGGAPTQKPRVLLPARPVSQQTLKKGVESSEYRAAARLEINRLKAAGLNEQEIQASMEKSGWR